MKKISISGIEFSVKYKETGIPVNIDDIAEEEWAKNLIQCDMEGVFIGEDGQLILADECGNFVYVPREGKYIITVFVGTNIYEMEW